MNTDQATAAAPDTDVVVIGAGFAGIYATHLLRTRNGLGVKGFERGSDVGGTWYWNRYPGARCDAESVFYSYAFDDDIQQEWTWSERWAAQPEILEYLNFVADRLGIREAFSFDTTITAVEWDDASQLWHTTTEAGETTTSRFVVTAVGCLSSAQVPHFDGLDDFRGQIHHTGNWPHEGVDFSGKRVAVIGTGSSGIQSIPLIAEQADHVTVFQRTPTYSVPARNRPMGPDEMARVKALYPQLRELSRDSYAGQIMAAPIGKAAELRSSEAWSELSRRWSEGGPTFLGAFADTLMDESANKVSADFVRERIEEIVTDPDIADLLKPDSYPIGTKRICVDTDYYTTYNRDNVDLVSVREDPIERITAAGPVVAGREYPVDVLVLATGFDAITGPLKRLGIVGRDGRRLTEEWEHGGVSYLGLAVAGFPNLFTVTGPGSPSVLTNMVAAIEQHVEWISDLLDAVMDAGVSSIEADRQAQDDWVEQVNAVADQTLYPTAASWYMGANIPGKPRVFMPFAGGLGPYRSICDDVVASGYAGFTTPDGPAPVAVAGRAAAAAG